MPLRIHRDSVGRVPARTHQSSTGIGHAVGLDEDDARHVRVGERDALAAGPAQQGRGDGVVGAGGRDPHEEGRDRGDDPGGEQRPAEVGRVAALRAGTRRARPRAPGRRGRARIAPTQPSSTAPRDEQRTGARRRTPRSAPRSRTASSQELTSKPGSTQEAMTRPTVAPMSASSGATQVAPPQCTGCRPRSPARDLAERHRRMAGRVTRCAAAPWEAACVSRRRDRAGGPVRGRSCCGCRGWTSPASTSTDPTRIVFDYVRRLGDVVDAVAPPGSPLRVVHVGGAGLTLPRYVAATRPRSAQVVLEPAAEVTELVRRELPLPRNSGIKVRGVDGRTGVAALRDGHRRAGRRGRLRRRARAGRRS